jgi:hypothetical protein
VTQSYSTRKHPVKQKVTPAKPQIPFALLTNVCRPAKSKVRILEDLARMTSGLLRLWLQGGIVTPKPKTYYPQVPLKIVKKIAEANEQKEVIGGAEPKRALKRKIIGTRGTNTSKDLNFMNCSLDIFQIECNGSLLWQGLAATIKEAKERVQGLQARSPGQYMIMSLKTGSKFLINSDGRASSAVEPSAPTFASNQARG